MPLPAGYRDRQLSPRLTRSVEAFWTHRATHSGTSLVLPDGRCDIILRYNDLDNTPPYLVLTGPATRAFAVPKAQGTAGSACACDHLLAISSGARELHTCRTNLFEGPRRKRFCPL